MFRPLEGAPSVELVDIYVDGATVRVAKGRTLAIALLEAGHPITRRNHWAEPCAPYSPHGRVLRVPGASGWKEQRAGLPGQGRSGHARVPATRGRRPPSEVLDGLRPRGDRRGPAGMAAATKGAGLGLKVLLLDEQAQAGGQIYRRVQEAGPQALRILGNAMQQGANWSSGCRPAERTPASVRSWSMCRRSWWCTCVSKAASGRCARGS